jgi:hypothetical protein
MSSNLERALAAEDQVEALQTRVKDLEDRLKGVLNTDPTTATRALAWMHRAENGEDLIGAVLTSARAGEINSTALPPGWLARAEAQMKALDILRRDEKQLMDAPDDETWEQWQKNYPNGKTLGVIRARPRS